MAATTEPQLTLKLLVDTKSNRVLFAEAGKDAVDFLFSLLTMPMGSIAKHLSEERMADCYANLYKSVDELDDAYVLPYQSKSQFLSPTTPAHSWSKSNLLLTDPSTLAAPKKLYRCAYTGYIDCRTLYTDVSGTRCPNCKNPMVNELRYVAPTTAIADVTAAEGSGFVKGVVTYTVTDGLLVTPMSTISCIALLNKLEVKDVGSLEERIVTLGKEEALKLLEASLKSNTVLSDVFLIKKTTLLQEVDEDTADEKSKTATTKNVNLAP